MAAAALAMMLWGIDRPALWLDESASVVATQRTWTGLWAMLGGTDAPLVPYYALLKSASSAVTLVAPSAVSAPEVLFRWPSVVVTVLAAWALTLWLVRRCPPELAICTGALLLAIGSFSRYGQEARPYAFVLAAAVACTILWTRLMHDRRWRWIALYALAVVALVAAHLLAASLVVAHLVAAAVTASSENRRPVVLRTAGAAALGLLVASPFALMASLHGQGTRPRVPLAPAEVPGLVVQTLTENGSVALGVGGGLAVAAAAAIYAARIDRRRYHFITWLAVAWAVVPLAVLFPLVLLRPNLLKVRYIMFVLPGWAILGGLSIVVVMDLIARGLDRLARWTDPNGAQSRRRLITAATYGVGVLAVAGVVASQVETLKAIRTPGGHGEDIRPALVNADRIEYAHLPIVVSPPNNALEVAAYAPAAEDRLSGLNVQRDQPSIWPKADPTTNGRDHLRRDRRVVLLMRAPTTGQCRWTSKRAAEAAAYVRQCLPESFKEGVYQVEQAEASGRRWTFAVLTYR